MPLHLTTCVHVWIWTYNFYVGLYVCIYIYICLPCSCRGNLLMLHICMYVCHLFPTILWHCTVACCVSEWVSDSVCSSLFPQMVCPCSTMKATCYTIKVYTKANGITMMEHKIFWDWSREDCFSLFMKTLKTKTYSDEWSS